MMVEQGNAPGRREICEDACWDGRKTMGKNRRQCLLALFVFVTTGGEGRAGRDIPASCWRCVSSRIDDK